MNPMNCSEVNSPNDGRQAGHIPVLAERISEAIKLSADAVVVDGTVGHGGHCLLFGRGLGPGGTILGMDVDEDCIQRAQSILKELSCRVILVRENFRSIGEVMRSAGLEKADLVFADLGVCSAQLCDDRRGLSFQENMPLDMRLDDRLDETAADIVNETDEKTLADLIYEYGEDRASRRIARFIVEERAGGPIRTTGQLAGVVSRALRRKGHGGWSRIHPATRTFQALRIAVNDELGALKDLLESGPGILKTGGKFGVISFHSLEDRIVKQNFRKNAADGIYDILTKKPIIASKEEMRDNPRARSAKLRIAERRA
jgi:16S rRNA (cytosine1402-N4)-methyltransferase